MTARRLTLFAFALLAVAGGALLWLQRQAGGQLRGELALLRERSDQLAAERALNRRLASEQVAAGELERLRADREALGRLRRELAELEGAAPKPPIARKDEAGEAMRTSVPASEWKNAGRATPHAAVETALWAAAGGDIERLAELLTLGPEARRRAEAVLAGLPAEVRAEYPTPEKFAALFTARDVPPGAAMTLYPTKARNDHEVTLRVELEHREAAERGTRHAARGALLTLRRFGDGWKLVVPESAVAKYVATLKSPGGIEARTTKDNGGARPQAEKKG